LGQAVAGPRTMVGVKFVLDAYQTHFSGARKAQLEKDAAAMIVAKLKEQIGFLDFTDAPGGDFVLTWELKPHSTPERPTAPREVGFHLARTGQGIQAARDYIIFRGEDDFSRIGEPPEMVAEMRLKLPDEEYAGRIAQLLRKVPIARTGHVMLTPPVVGWLL